MSDISNADVFDLSGQSPTVPQFDKINVRVRTGNVTKATSDDGKNSVIIPLQFEQEAEAVDGRKVPVGFQLTYKINTDVKGGRTKEMVQRDLVRFQAPTLGLKEGKPWDNAELSGKLVDVYLTLRPDTNDPQKSFQNFRFDAVK